MKLLKNYKQSAISLKSLSHAHSGSPHEVEDSKQLCWIAFKQIKSGGKARTDKHNLCSRKENILFVEMHITEEMPIKTK